MFGVIVWALFGILILRLGIKGLFSGELQLIGKAYSGKRGRILALFFLIVGVASFAFAFYRLLVFVPKQP
jgi:uncharacterized membrane protein